MATEAIRTSEPARLRFGERLAEVLRHREVLVNLIRKELRIKYKSSFLGVAWSMLNPLLYLAVFYVVFTFFLRNDTPNFAVYLVSGLLGFTLFSTGLQGATSSVVANASLVTKVAFPREILPLSAIGASLVYFFYQLLVLLLFVTVLRYPYVGANLLLLPAALAVLLLFTSALGLGTAALNVRYRDTHHLVELGLLAWFWVTPIVYPASVVFDNVGSDVAIQIWLANPITAVTLAFQRAIYGGTSTVAQSFLPDAGIEWYLIRLGYVAAASVLLLALTWRTFFRLSGDFAEEL
ncbi:MAG: ABC transporter permease [Actinomycetota bacterium]